MKPLLVAIVVLGLLRAGPASAQSATFVVIQEPPPHQGWLRAAVAAHAVAQFADVSTTANAMGRGGFREVNPIARPFASDPIKLAVFKGTYAVATSYLFLKLGKSKPKTAIVGAVLHTVLTSWVAARNARTVRSAP